MKVEIAAEIDRLASAENYGGDQKLKFLRYGALATTAVVAEAEADPEKKKEIEDLVNEWNETPSREAQAE